MDGRQEIISTWPAIVAQISDLRRQTEGMPPILPDGYITLPAQGTATAPANRTHFRGNTTAPPYCRKHTGSVK